MKKSIHDEQLMEFVQPNEDTVLKKFIEDAYENIITNYENPLLDIKFFLRYYYPLFRYYIQRNRDILREKDKNTSLTLEWITFAGGPFIEVDLFEKEGTENKILFTLPSIYAKPEIKGGRIDGLEDSLQNFNNKNQRLHAEGQRYFKHHIEPTKNLFKDCRELHTKRWLSVLDAIEKHYQLPPVFEEEKREDKKVVEKQERLTTEDLGFEY